MYEITRKGFTFLAMGFNGKKAAGFKEAYIDEFDRMEELIRSGQGQEVAMEKLNDPAILRSLLLDYVTKVEHLTPKAL